VPRDKLTDIRKKFEVRDEMWMKQVINEAGVLKSHSVHPVQV